MKFKVPFQLICGCLFSFLSSCTRDSHVVIEIEARLEYVNAQGLSIFDKLNNSNISDSDVSVYFIINGTLVNFNDLPSTIAHRLQAFNLVEENNKKTLILQLNDHLVDDKSTTLVQLKGYPADTLVGHFRREDNSIFCIGLKINGSVHEYGEVVKIIK